MHLPRPNFPTLYGPVRNTCTGDAVIFKSRRDFDFDLFRSVLQLLNAQTLIGQHGNLVIVIEVEALNVASLFPTPHVSVDDECRYALLADSCLTELLFTFLQ